MPRLRYPDGHVVHETSGDHVSFSKRYIRYRHPNFRINLPLDQPVELLLRVQSQSSMQVPMVLYTPRAFAEVLRDAQFSTGLCYGIVLALDDRGDSALARSQHGFCVRKRKSARAQQHQQVVQEIRGLAE